MGDSLLAHPRNRRVKSQRILAIGLAAVVVLGVCALYYFPPSTARFYPPCLLNALTDGRVHCPGCGITRSLHALLHGDLEQALAYNVLFVLLLPLIVYYFFRVWYHLLTDRSLPPERAPRWALLSMFAVILLFAILRNLPAEPFRWLAPHAL
jgi:hypothetical protein